MEIKQELNKKNERDPVEKKTSHLMTTEEVLQETAGITLSDSSIRSISEAIGKEIETITQAEVEKSQKEDPPEPQA